MVINPPLILASASPRRRELLEELGVSFEVIAADVQELDALCIVNSTPVQLALENARLKAEAVALLAPGRWILGADTVVALGDRIFGKPSSLGQAAEFLHALGGQTHEVITACVLRCPSGEEDLFHDLSLVTFLPLSEEIIDRYLAEVPVLDKAGAYAVQERSEWIVASLEGSRTNIIGLPTEKLAKLLQSRGLL